MGFSEQAWFGPRLAAKTQNILKFNSRSCPKGRAKKSPGGKLGKMVSCKQHDGTTTIFPEPQKEHKISVASGPLRESRGRPAGQAHSRGGVASKPTGYGCGAPLRKTTPRRRADCSRLGVGRAGVGFGGPRRDADKQERAGWRGRSGRARAVEPRNQGGLRQESERRSRKNTAAG